MAFLFLQAGMGMIPIGAGLRHGILVGERLARLDTGEGHARHAIHLEGHKQAVPVNASVGIERVGDVERDLVSFAESYQRGGQRSIDAGSFANPSIDPHGKFPNT